MKKVFQNPLNHLSGNDEYGPAGSSDKDLSDLFATKTWVNWSLGTLLLLFLFITSRYNYLLFHTLAEFFSITVAFSLFVIVWNSRHLTDNNAFVFLGIAYLFIGSIDLVHTLSYKGLGVISADWGANPATQLWIAARLMESITLFLFPLFFFRKLRPNRIIGTYFAITALIFITVFYWRIFPDCFIEGAGLTPFKKISEYVICGILVAAFILLRAKKRHVDQTVYRLMVFSIAITILGELAFTFYVSVYGISNLAGHYFKVISFFLIYLALVKTSLKRPYEILFRELDQSEKKFKSLFDKMTNGVALHEMICDEHGKPIDYRFLNVNAAFEKLTGLRGKHLIGNTVLEVLPNTEKTWIETYGNVALTGHSIQFSNYSQELKKHFEVSAYCPNPGQFVTIFSDITERKNAAIEKDRLIKELQKAANEIKTLRGILPICSHCKKIRDDKGYWNQIEGYIKNNTDVDFSHGICPECANRYYPDLQLYDEEEPHP